MHHRSSIFEVNIQQTRRKSREEPSYKIRAVPNCKVNMVGSREERSCSHPSSKQS